MSRAWTCAAAVIVAATLHAGDEPAMEVVLARVATYVADYQKRLAGIVAEEHYRQNVQTTTRGGRTARQFRELRSDLLLVKPGGEDRWLQFRDVFEVDRKPIRDRDERLYKLFLDTTPTSRTKAEAIQAESARYNIGPLLRTVNIPILALVFFERSNQPRMRFEKGDTGNVRRFAGLAEAKDIWLIEYRELAPETLIRGDADKDMPSHGRMWIDSATGRILRTELRSEDLVIRAFIDVAYKAEPGLDLLVPGEMRESYVLRRSDEARIDGRASYSRFRQFVVTTTEKPKQ